MIPKLKRYIMASLSRVLDPVLTAENYALWIEGVDFDESNILQRDNAVLRVVGPVYMPSSSVDHYKVEVVVLITDLLDHSSNAYELTETAGAVANALASPIPVAEWGDGDAAIGCLDLDPDAKEFLRIADYGVIEKDTRVKQMAVIVKYHIDLDS